MTANFAIASAARQSIASDHIDRHKVALMTMTVPYSPTS